MKSTIDIEKVAFFSPQWIKSVPAVDGTYGSVVTYINNVCDQSVPAADWYGHFNVFVDL